MQNVGERQSIHIIEYSVVDNGDVVRIEKEVGGSIMSYNPMKIENAIARSTLKIING